MYKHQGFAVGQVIKALDFEPRPERGECSITGKIVAVRPEGNTAAPYAHYEIIGQVDMWDGAPITDKHSRVGLPVYVPMEVSLFEYDSRVTEVA